MKEDLRKFMELVQTDASLQKKLEEAVKNYDGEQTEEEVFRSVVAPIAREAGCSLTLDGLKQSIRELDLDEMGQVAGGMDAMRQGGGVGMGACGGFGAGFGWTAAVMDDDNNVRGHFCILIGIGDGGGLCLTAGCVMSTYKDH